MDLECIKSSDYTAGRTGWPWIAEESLKVSRPIERDRWPGITVVTPSFNQGRFIEETIRSVLLQDYPNLEYIIIDGGSRDNTIDIIKKYESWVSYWVSEKDRGQCHAINKGFERATGDIFAWLCSDDVYAPGALRKVADVMGGQKMGMAIGDAILTHGPESLEGRLDHRRPAFEDMAYNVKTLAQPSVFWTNDLWKTVGPLNEDLYFLMDYDFWLRMVPMAASVSYVDSVLSYERTHPDQKNNPNHPLMYRHHQERARVAYQAAQARGESGIGWLARVWWFRLKRAQGRFWTLREPGFHWQAARQVLKAAGGKLQ